MNDLLNFLHQDMLMVNEIIMSHTASEEKLATNISDYLLSAGGKRIRPMLTILMSKIFKSEGESRYLLAAAVEFLHSATLLHDDVVDESDMRRSQPTAHLKWGNKASILVGDFLFSQSFKLMIKANSTAALKALSEAFILIIEGEVRQLSRLQLKVIITEQEYFKIIQAKTAELFGTSCEIGAIISQSSKEVSQLVKNFGLNLGLMFQLVDDLLDYYGNPNSLGKNIGDDFYEGKVTLPVIFGYELASKIEKDFLLEKFFSSNKTPQDFYEIVEIFDKYKVTQLVQRLITKLKQETIIIIEKMHIGDSDKKLLGNLVEYVIHRSQ